VFGRCASVFPLFAVAAFAGDARSFPVQYWDLPGGSHIAHVHYPGIGPHQPDPVIFLHGGPGGYLVDHPQAADRFYESVARLGFDVYLYDQIGSGRSARLSDPRQYTVDRHIRDLEAIRRMVRAQRMILVGDSWGASLAANYIAQHPDRCAKAIFSGPGAISGDLPSDTYDDAPMVRAAEAWFAALFAQPRYRPMGDIRNADIPALYRTLPDREMDPPFDAFVQRTLPFLVCDPGRLPSDAAAFPGMGWWANLMTSADFRQRPGNPRPRLAQMRSPVPILRGGCDYLRWEVAYQYKTAFPNSTLIYVPEAGHAFGYDQPGIYSEAVRAFLLDRPLPVAPYTGSAAPPRVPPRAATPPAGNRSRSPGGPA